MAKDWKVPKRKQPVWRVTKKIISPFFKAKEVVFEGEKFPDKCIIVSNHNNKKGPMVFEVSLPVFHATWGAYQMLGTYKERFRYLRDVLYIQKNGFSKFKATMKAWFEAIFSIYMYRGMKILPSYPDARFRKTLQYSMAVLEAGCAVSMYPEDSSEGYFEELTHFLPGFVMLAQQYYKKTGEDVPVFPMYWGRKGNKIVVGKPLYVQDFVKEGLNREEIAEQFRLAVNGLYYKYFKK
ncbi:MAG: hypothetical protein IJY62_05315 [Clostridia bacterium]|nr:hypothetical protein [Clostridia bacterium]